MIATVINIPGKTQPHMGLKNTLLCEIGRVSILKLNMNAALITTKLHIPDPMIVLVKRKRLFSLLDECLARGKRLVLVKSPAGSGKTSLISGWLKTRTEAKAWVALDANDNDAQSFLLYFLHAVEQAFPELSGKLLLPQTSDLVNPIEQTMANMINELDALERPLIICLDDYHLIESSCIHSALSFFLANMPATVTVVLLTRTQAAIPLSRLRVHDQLLEILADDLAFSLDETKLFFEQAHQLTLSPREIEQISEKTEGWAAGLQLTALACKTSPYEAEKFSYSSNLLGTHEFVADYLLEEVLDRLPDAIQNFLMKTSILDRFNIALCGDVLGEGVDSVEEKINILLKHNLFLIALDANRSWFRYHHLFAELLQSRLQKKFPGFTEQGHKVASGWFEKNGMLIEAIDHASKSADQDRISNLLRDHWVEILHQGNIDLFLLWLKFVPEEKMKTEPLLCVAAGWALCLQGNFVEAIKRIQQAELGLQNTLSAHLELNDPLVATRIQTEIALVNALCANGQGKWMEGVRFAEEAHSLAFSHNPLLEGNARILLGHSYRGLGKVDLAIRAFQEGIPNAWQGGNVQGAMGAIRALVTLYIDKGDLHTSEITCMRGISMTSAINLEKTPAAAQLYLALAEIRYEQNKLDEADEMLQKGLEQGRYGGSFEFLRYSALIQAKMYFANGFKNEAIEVLEGAARVIEKLGDVSASAEIKAMHAALLTRVQRVDEALAWLRNAQMDQGSWSAREMNSLCAAEVLLSVGRAKEAEGLLTGLIREAKPEGRQRCVFSALLLRSRVYQCTDRAHLAEADLRQAKEWGRAHSYVRALIEAGFAIVNEGNGIAQVGNVGNDDAELPIFSLSKREREVFFLIEQGLTNQEIADRLFISLTTAKKHTSSILNKLNLTRRTQLVALRKRVKK